MGKSREPGGVPPRTSRSKRFGGAWVAGQAGAVMRLAILLTMGCGLRAEVSLTGRATNDNNAPVPGARIVLKRAAGVVAETVTDPAGAFTLRLPAPGEYGLAAERDRGFAG